MTIEVTGITLDQKTTAESPDLHPGNYIRLSVVDTGTGMSADTKSHLFESFFTTKAPGKGTGLGLATCYGIVKDSGGEIVVRSNLGEGSTFEVYLPKLVPTLDLDPPGAGADSLPVGNETILLVEDEPAVRSLAANVLRRQGYTMLEASDGEEALKVVSNQARDIDLLLSDLVMPRMGGIELLNKIEMVNLKLRVLFTSGYPDEEANLCAVSGDNVPFLPKPYSPSDLAMKVREVLDLDYPG